MAQEDTDQIKSDAKTEENLENVAEQLGEDADLSELIRYRQLTLANKLNINKAEAEDLTPLYLLSDIQIGNLILHRSKHGKLLALEELQSIEGFDLQTIEALLPYVSVNESDFFIEHWSDIWRRGKHQFTLRYEQVLEDKQGYILHREDETGEKGYLGDASKLYARYRFTLGRKLSYGITAEKDPGEEFFAGTQSQGFDFYSAHVFVRDISFVKSIALGDYQASYGQGLVLWSALAFGKGSDLSSIKRNPMGIAPYTSVNEALFRRGAAASIQKGKWSLDVLYSNKNWDANVIASDTSEATDELFVSSLGEDGYHRTKSEIEDKDAIQEQMLASHLAFRNKRFTAGFTIAQHVFDGKLNPGSQLYNIDYFRGDELLNYSVDYNYVFKNINLFGELAQNKKGSIAYTGGALISLGQYINWVLLYRNIDMAYNSFLVNSIRESSNGGESGILNGITIKPSSQWQLSAYFDMFQFPWLRYQVNAPSIGYEYLFQIDYKPSRKVLLYARIKEQDKKANSSDDEDESIDYLVSEKSSQLRLHASYQVHPNFSLKTRMERIRYQKESKDENGYVFYQDFSYEKLGSPFSLTLRYALFDSPSYDSRVYAYENDVPGAYSIPAYYHKGARYYALVKYRIRKGMSIWGRYSVFNYFNRDLIGSGNEAIDGNIKSDIKAVLRIDF
ncbi:MAG TPA: helix-hairpin-helix domain-containing protein [Bacteroidia bacterium]|nr:helix-hairpin-helix domain-containing protein [Bacteroidia bacterium]HNT79910.1 helix-hairpin-helix domain-containing protein [Bacteroidia bacterium]